MKVIKRNGDQEDVSFDKVLRRIKVLSDGLDVDIFELAKNVCSRIYDGVKTSELDELAAHMCSSMIVEHPHYGALASRIIISNHHKNTSPSLSETVNLLFNNTDGDGNPFPLVSEELYANVMQNREKLNAYIDYSRDYTFDYFGFKTLERGYLMKSGGKTIERPQHMFMRVALGIHGSDIRDALATYDLMSKKYFTHATPTLFNAGTPRPQNSSCYLVHVKDDSIDGIYETLSDCAAISKYAGGIGLHVHNVRSRNSLIKGTNGLSTGIVPMLRVFNATARYVNQSGKRNGSIAIFLEPWHADIEQFMDLRKNFGNEEDRTRDLFLAVWVPDLFMRRVRDGGVWSLMCPNTCKGLSDVYGAEFDELYESYEKQGRFVKQVPAQELWFRILESQIETGVPYVGYKDHVNRKTNQSNIGIIKSSNLCMEICQVSTPDEISVCNLASICLPSFLKESSGQGELEFDFASLQDVVRVIVKNLNKIIDNNFYPCPKAKVSNLRHRPIGIGVQGLADLFIRLRMPFDSEQANELNRDIFAAMYFAALDESCRLAEKMGAYETFAGSPASLGLLQFDLWGVTPVATHEWDSLKARIGKFGLRNSLLLAPMPTASTSQIMGFNECFEPITSNIYKRKTLAGEFIIVNKYLVDDLVGLGLWTKDMKNRIIIAEGSVQDIESIPDGIKSLYKTAWEIKQKAIIDMAATRGPYICQSQSMNLFLANPDFKKLSSMHFYAWQKGLKTGMYYLRTKPKAKTQQFTIDPSQSRLANARLPPTSLSKNTDESEDIAACPIGCTSCSS